MSAAARKDNPAPAREVYVGLMSGTSLDGISAAAVRFPAVAKGRGTATHELLGALNLPYSAQQRAALERATAGATPGEYCVLSFELGEWLAAAAVAVIAEAGVSRSDVAAIGSHGQTVWHEPGRATWQIGESAVIAERTGIPVVSDFRVRDVAAGGHGAPLVPIADALLFAHPTGWRALQNIGGIANVTVVPPAGDLSGVRAFDTGPGVAVLDAVVRTLFPSLHHDEDGRIAQSGAPIDAVVEELLRHPYFSASPPKTTGREEFGAEYAARLMALCRERGRTVRPQDAVATATALTARSIARAYSSFLPEPVHEVLLSGGGARNPALVEMLKREMTPLPVRGFEEEFFDADAKEAVAFALLAHLHLSGRAGNVPTATGARGPRILGKLTPA